MSILRVLIPLAVVVACTGIAAAVAAPAATDPPPVASLECQVGDSWTFQYTTKDSYAGPGLNGSETFTRTACGDRETLRPTGAVVKPSVVSDAAGNIYSTYSDFTGVAEKFGTPIPEFRLPLTPGKTWESGYDVDMGSGRGFNGTGHWTIVGWESVTVPAGTFLCVRKELKLEFSFLRPSINGKGGEVNMTGHREITTWYAPAARADVKSLAVDSFGGTASHELTALSLNK
jgi:hypothetical protein